MITESPRNIAAPITPSSSTNGVRRPSARVASEVSDSVPPSPLLSARSSTSTYLMRDDDDQRPQDHRQHAEHRVARDRTGLGRRHRRHAEGVERACADVAIDHADAAERQRPETGSWTGPRSTAGLAGGEASPATSLMIGAMADRAARVYAASQQERRPYTPPTAKTTAVPRCNRLRNIIRRPQLRACRFDRNWRRFPHQGDGDAAIGRDERVVGKQRLGVGPAGHHEEIARSARPRSSRILRTALARSADSSHGP